MRRLRIGILDLVAKSPHPSLYGRVMNANLASIMPQVVGIWCEQAGHEVHFVCYTGTERLLNLPTELDLLFVSAFTQSAQLAYALSNLCRQRGVVTALGGPHARCYPEDARKYYDYVLGLTDQQAIAEVLHECAPHRPLGREVGASRHSLELPSLEERWKFIEPTLAKAPAIAPCRRKGSDGSSITPPSAGCSTPTRRCVGSWTARRTGCRSSTAPGSSASWGRCISTSPRGPSC